MIFAITIKINNPPYNPNKKIEYQLQIFINFSLMRLYIKNICN
jgi:hypothetical protein